MAALGTASTLSSGTGTYTLPAGVGYWFIENQDTAPLKIAFLNTGGSWAGVSNFILSPASFTGQAGGWIDSLRFPYFDPAGFTITSTVASAQFGSGCTINDPFAQEKGVRR